MNKQRVFNLIILDESGSMESIKAATISGFNEIVQTIKEVEKQFPEQEHFISLVTFNGVGIKTLLNKQAVADLSELDANTYKPNASTPLFDAIGFSANGLNNDLLGQTDFNVLVTILTDGEENASKEFSGAQVKQLIEGLKNKGWTFTYIGANHNVEGVAAAISIENIMKFVANEEDMQRMFSDERKSRVSYSKKLSNKENVQRNYFSNDTDKDKT